MERFIYDVVTLYLIPYSQHQLNTVLIPTPEWFRVLLVLTHLSLQYIKMKRMNSIGVTHHYAMGQAHEVSNRNCWCQDFRSCG
ncbi:MAG TPA: hypothetical protein PLG17_04275 [Thermodesulfobacteriota bacterium]|nr:hypothetical protein [Thermodesulfobacteriota bacterium]